MFRDLSIVRKMLPCVRTCVCSDAFSMLMNSQSHAAVFVACFDVFFKVVTKSLSIYNMIDKDDNGSVCEKSLSQA
jgi:hypothetical protein